MEDYLKTIYLLRRPESSEIIRISDIAASMSISKASVCRATDVLAKKGLLTKDKYIGVSFTNKGYEQALFITKRYTVLERFLHEVLGVDLSIAKQDACSIEHAISIESYKSICQFLCEKKMCLALE